MRIAISGFSGSGKTMFITNLMHRLIDDFTVLVIKETHNERVDIASKDSHRHCEAGASACALISEKETAVFIPGPQNVDSLTAMVDADVVFLEGFKHSHCADCTECMFFDSGLIPNTRKSENPD